MSLSNATAAGLGRVLRFGLKEHGVPAGQAHRAAPTALRTITVDLNDRPQQCCEAKWNQMARTLPQPQETRGVRLGAEPMGMKGRRQCQAGQEVKARLSSQNSR
jgi:hypothetical protein